MFGPFTLSLLFAFLVGTYIADSQLLDPDLPGTWSSKIESIPSCSWIIPMDLVNQQDSWSGQTDINLGAYGLVNALLWADVPVKWAIAQGKAQDENDISSVPVWDITGTNGLANLPAANAQTKSFNGGPFIVITIFTEFASPIYVDFNARRAANYAPVRVFKTSTSFNADIRYTLLDRPYVAIFDSSTRKFVLESALIAAGFQSGVHYKIMSKEEAVAVSSTSCVTMAMEPHFHCSGDANATSIVNGETYCSYFMDAARAFVTSGGNFLSQCGGVLTYEQCDNQYEDGKGGVSSLQGSDTVGLARDKPPQNTSQCKSGFWFTNGGLNANSGNGKSLENSNGNAKSSGFYNYVNMVPDTPFAQYTGQWYFEATSSVPEISLWNTAIDTGTSINTTLNTINRAHFVVKNPSNARETALGDPYGVYYAGHAKLQQYHGQKGGNVFFLAGHDYGYIANTDPTQPSSSCTTEPCVNKPGRRLLLNAVLTPANRPSTCSISVQICGVNGTNCTMTDRTFKVNPCTYGVCYAVKRKRFTEETEKQGGVGRGSFGAVQSNTDSVGGKSASSASSDSAWYFGEEEFLLRHYDSLQQKRAALSTLSNTAPPLLCSCGGIRLDACGVCGGTNTTCATSPIPAPNEVGVVPFSYFPPSFAQPGTASPSYTGPVSYLPVTQPPPPANPPPTFDTLRAADLLALLYEKPMSSLNPLADGSTVSEVTIDLSRGIAIFPILGSSDHSAYASQIESQFANTISLLLQVNISRVFVDVQGDLLVVSFDAPPPIIMAPNVAPVTNGTTTNLTTGYNQDILGAQAVVKYYRIVVGENIGNFQVFVTQLVSEACRVLFMLQRDDYPTEGTSECITNETSLDFNFNYALAVKDATLCPIKRADVNGTWYVAVKLVSDCKNIPISVEQILEEKPPKTVNPVAPTSFGVRGARVDVVTGVLMMIMMWVMMRTF